MPSVYNFPPRTLQNPTCWDLAIKEIRSCNLDLDQHWGPKPAIHITTAVTAPSNNGNVRQPHRHLADGFLCYCRACAIVMMPYDSATAAAAAIAVLIATPADGGGAASAAADGLLNHFTTSLRTLGRCSSACSTQRPV